jgi:TolB-like protein/tetratricopeptide (TPR) repeat protein
MSAPSRVRARIGIEALRRSWGGFFRELRRRQVSRVAVTYGAVGWIVVQASTALVPALGIPHWTLSLVTVLLLLGFPVALVLAWAVDLTPLPASAGGDGGPAVGWPGPDAPGPEAPGPDAPETDAPETDAPDSAVSGMVAPGPGMSGGGEARGRRDAGVAGRTVSAPSSPPPSIRTVAALPFTDRSPEGGFQFLGDGITEELISALARMEGIQVLGRSSVFGLRDDALEAREVGRRLGVGSVVEGSLRVSGSRLRVTAQLVDTRTGYVRWSATRGGTVDDLLDLQGRMAEGLAEALGARLLPPSTRREGSEGPETGSPAATHDAEAYQLYLRGRFHWNERTAASLEAARRYFRRATMRDPEYTRAHAGQANALALLMEYGLLSPAEGMAPAQAAAEAALRWGSNLPEAHVSAGLVHQLGWRWGEAEDAYRTALALDPGHSDAHQRLALLLAWQGSFDEARRELDAALAWDPLSPAAAATEGWLRYYSRDPAGAVLAHARALDDHPTLEAARVGMGLALLVLDRPGSALETLSRAPSAGGDTPDTPALRSLQALALARNGRGAEARNVLLALQSEARVRFISPFHLALPLLELEGPEAALAELTRAGEARAPQVAYLGVDPLFDPLRSLPGFRRLLETTGIGPRIEGEPKEGPE